MKVIEAMIAANEGNKQKQVAKDRMTGEVRIKGTCRSPSDKIGEGQVQPHPYRQMAKERNNKLGRPLY